MGGDRIPDTAKLMTRVKAHVVAWLVEWAITGEWPVSDIKDLIDALEAAFDMDFTEDET